MEKSAIFEQNVEPSLGKYQLKTTLSESLLRLHVVKTIMVYVHVYRLRRNPCSCIAGENQYSLLGLLFC